ncbi:MAG TPA: hypothetical protein VHE09_02025 [Rhizomicrobium sp.]|nr:hypothetical protein [Rhizomicrobium sp.]
MPVDDERNILHIGPPQRAGDPEITSAMAEAVRQRIEAAGGTLTVWAVLHEDVYETRLGDGFYLHVKAVALNGDDAHRLAGLANESEWTTWHVKSYRLGLKDGLPAFLAARPESDEFRIGDFVAIIAEIPPGGTASKLHTGTGRRADGPFIALPAK